MTTDISNILSYIGNLYNNLIYNLYCFDKYEKLWYDFCNNIYLTIAQILLSYIMAYCVNLIAEACLKVITRKVKIPAVKF